MREHKLLGDILRQAAGAENLSTSPKGNAISKLRVIKNEKNFFLKIVGDSCENAINFLIYTDEEKFSNPRNSTTYLIMNSFLRKGFNIFVSIDNDPSLVENMDVVAMRKNPPLDEDFIRQLSNYDDGSRLFINPPETQIYFSNKKYLLDLMGLDILPETLVSSNLGELINFYRDVGSCILKPCYGFGGKGIIKIPKRKRYLELEKIFYDETVGGSREIILQRFIKNVDKLGDKRIHLVKDKPLGAVLRLPAKGNYLCNISSGGKGYKTEITKKDYEIVEKLKYVITDKRIFWSGIDVIGNYLGEINAISPGLLARADELNGTMMKEDSLMVYFMNAIREEVGNDN